MLVWHNDAWTDYLEWQTLDRRKFAKINSLIKTKITSNKLHGVTTISPPSNTILISIVTFDPGYTNVYLK